MRDPFAPGAGGVLSADIAVPEHAQQLSFYSKILTTGSDPLWREDLTNNRGTPVIGLGERTPEYDSLPLQWMPHIQVLDLGRSTSRCVALGGRELMHGRDEHGQSQWAVLEDPNGAAFGLIPVVPGEAMVVDELESLGRIAGLSLTVSDAPSTSRFYEEVVGWSAAPGGTDDGFEMRRPNGVAAATICPSSKESAGIPAVWVLSLPVDDLSESLRLVLEGGGEIITGSSETGYAVLRDPLGVHIALQVRSKRSREREQ